MDIYDRINIKLKEQDKKKTVLCSAIDLSYNTLTSLFRRKSKNITIDTIRKIANFLGCSADYLITGEEIQQEKDPYIVSLFNKLSDKNQERAISYLEGMLASQNEEIPLFIFGELE